MDDINQLFPLPEKSYVKVFDKLKLKYLKRGKTLKHPGETDRVSRYLCEGFIGSYKFNGSNHALFMIFKQTDIVFDERSFRSGIPSDTLLKCITDVVFYEFTRDSERELLSANPDFVTVAHKISLRINECNSNVFELSKKKLDPGYKEFVKMFPGLEPEITNEDLGAFFGISRRTVERFKHDLKNFDL
ncbi:Crp/Fnr family transcriptional regulator [Algoriphagus sp. Y33]|uniref:Crp/Fnr family transcriptional regulator n=1 Tax=Algoriphagus sp. Y33 TaxID=2772483 RepID=UPI00178584A1|nr:Crp/Fnr family transcriptional regulator [Algoriphagus sp. Y33]